MVVLLLQCSDILLAAERQLCLEPLPGKTANVVIDESASDMPIGWQTNFAGKLLQATVPVESFAPIARKRARHAKQKGDEKPQRYTDHSFWGEPP